MLKHHYSAMWPAILIISATALVTNLKADTTANRADVGTMTTPGDPLNGETEIVMIQSDRLHAINFDNLSWSDGQSDDTPVAPPQYIKAHNILFEDFNSGLGKFTVYDMGYDDYTWSKETVDGNGVAHASSHYDYSNDDWLVSPAIELKAGIEYELAYKVREHRISGNDYYNPLMLEVKIGAGSEPDNITQAIGEKFTPESAELQTIKNLFTVSADGTYHIGFHHCSDYEAGGIDIDDVIVRLPMDDGVPAAPAISAAAVAEHLTDVAVTITLPTETNGGQPLDAITTVELYRGEDLVKTFDNVTPGQTIEYTDAEVKEHDLYKYTAIALNDKGNGPESSVSTLVGILLWETFDSSNGGFTDISVDGGTRWSYYSYNNAMRIDTRKNADDYLITPAIHLQGGSQYRLTFDVRNGQSIREETMDVVMGRNNKSADDFNVTLMDEFVIKNTPYTKYATKECIISVPESGDYYVAFHATSQNSSSQGYYLYLDNVRVDFSALQAGPEAVTDLTVTPDDNGTLTTGISLNAPLNDLNGNTITQNMTIDIERDGRYLTTIDGVSAGQAVTYADATVSRGAHTYSVYATLNGIQGPATQANVLSGDTYFPFIEDFENGFTYCTTQNFTGIDRIWSVMSGNDGNKYAGFAWSGDEAWLFTRSFPLKSGRTYHLSLDVDYEPSRGVLKIYYGKECSPTGMTVLIDDVPKASGTNTYVIIPAEDGIYHLGIYTNINSDVDNIRIDAEPEGTSSDAPAVTATADSDGKLYSTVDVAIPDTDIAGNPLSGLLWVELYRGVSIVGTKKNIAPGETVTFRDSVKKDDNYYYSSIVYNTSGNGKKSETSRIFIGEDYPVPPTGYVSDDDCRLMAYWTPPARGMNGGYINTAEFTYRLGHIDYNSGYSYDDNVYSPAGATQYDFWNINPDEGEQSYFRPYLSSVDRKKFKSSGQLLNRNGVEIIGAPYSLPFAETVADFDLNGTFWWFESNLSDYNKSPNFGIYAEDSYDSADNSGCIGWQPSYKDETLMLSTGKIAINNAANPALRFAIKAFKGSKARIEVIAKGQGNQVVKLADIDASTIAANEWIPYTLSLDAVKDRRYVLIQWNYSAGQSGSAVPVLLDDIHVTDACRHDVSVEMTTPSRIVCGRSADISLRLQNLGTDDVKDIHVSLTAGDKIIDSRDLQLLATASTEEYNVEFPSTIFDNAGNIVFKAQATVAEGDDDTTNNTVESEATVEMPVLAPVTDLKGQFSSSTALTLSWNNPQMPYTPAKQSFEDIAHGTINEFDDWTTIKVDNGKSAKIINNVTLPHEGESYAFMAMDWTQILDQIYATNPTLRPHDGSMELVSLTTSPQVKRDEWLISPELPGISQNISFWGCSFDGTGTRGLETYEVYYSVTGNDVNDFIPVSHNTMPDRWTQIVTPVPDGTRYFAIRHTSEPGNQFIFILDDIDYAALGGTIKGYNVYVDRNIAGTVTEPTWHGDVTPGAHEYAVTAIYDVHGESPATYMTLDTSGITAIGDDTINGPFDIYTPSGVKIRSQVYSTEGLQPGLYIINNRKIVIR